MVFNALVLLALLATAKESSGHPALAMGRFDMTEQTDVDDTPEQPAKYKIKFKGTDYDRDTCKLQFSSEFCDDNCGELNGYQLQCVSKGRHKGKKKKVCECKPEDTQWCHVSANPDDKSGPMFQFSYCSEEEKCVDSFGYSPVGNVGVPVCAEKLHCVKGIGKKGTAPVSLCLTCATCIAENDAFDAKLPGYKRRFNCSAICPQMVLDWAENEKAAETRLVNDN